MDIHTTRRRRLKQLLDDRYNGVQALGPVAGGLAPTGREIAVGYGESNLGANVFGLVVKGDDMYPEFVEGERVFFDPDIAPRAGDVVLASVNESMVFRKYRPRTEATADAAELLATNPDYAPIWSDRAKVRILAVMVEHHRSRRARAHHT